ncbi:MAG: type VI secretion system baseplate subunit TssK [Methylococcales bacterium]
MSWNNKVIWTEGMFLRPQHFQQQDRHFQSWTESRCSGLRPFGWGFTALEIDQQLLALGKFAVVSCRGIFPDGTPFNIPDDFSPPTPLEIPTDCKNEQIYLALPVERVTGRELSTENVDDELSRYRLQEIDAKDFHSTLSNSEATIQSGNLWTRFRLSRQDQGAFVTIPIAKIIERNTDGQIDLDDHFIPTSLHCQAAQRLHDYIEEIEGLLHHRGEAIATRLGSPGAGGVGEIVDFLLLQIINRYEPLFVHYRILEQLHPETLYSIMVQMAGELATITQSNRRPNAYPPYTHDVLNDSFDPLVAAIRASLNWETEARAMPIPLEERKYGIRTADIHDRELLQSAEFVLAVTADVATDKIHSQFPHQVTIAPVEKLRDLVMTHTPGIELRVLSVAPRQIPYHAGFTYFELEKSHALWKELEETGAIAMHFAGDYPGLDLEFWAIRG